MITLFPSSTYPTVATQAAPIPLRPNAPISLRLPAHTRITVNTGTVWITQPNDPADYLLSPGDTFTTTRPSRLVAQALRAPAQLTLSNF